VDQRHGVEEVAQVDEGPAGEGGDTHTTRRGTVTAPTRGSSGAGGAAGSGQDPRSPLTARPQRCKAKLKRRQPGPAERGGERAAGGQRTAGSTTKQMGLAYLSGCHLCGGWGGGLRWCHREAGREEDLLCGGETED